MQVIVRRIRDKVPPRLAPSFRHSLRRHMMIVTLCDLQTQIYLEASSSLCGWLVVLSDLHIRHNHETPKGWVNPHGGDVNHLLDSYGVLPTVSPSSPWTSWTASLDYMARRIDGVGDPACPLFLSCSVSRVHPTSTHIVHSH